MSLGVRAGLRLAVGFVLYGALFFGSAGTFDYWEAWMFMAALFLPMAPAFVYFARNAPDLLERRMKTSEKRPRQRAIIKLFGLLWLTVFVIPGFDHRLGWSTVPPALVVASNVMVMAAYLFIVRVLLENQFASRTIEVEEGQELITTGSYAVVRHPMYTGVVVLLMFMPPALGSYWALIPAVIMPALLVMRILDEEDALMEGLPGYREYMERTTKRLIPGVW
jgi:protein-S-isoprenylcysteine O-methyltransferase Ste14